MTIQTEARFVDADGRSVPSADGASRVLIVEVDDVTGAVVRRTYADVGVEPAPADDSAAHELENSDQAKTTWDLWIEADGVLKPVETLAELVELFNVTEEERRAFLLQLFEMPVWDVAPGELVREAYDYVRQTTPVGTKAYEPATEDKAFGGVARWWAEFIDLQEAALASVLERFWERQAEVVIARLRGTKARRGTRHWTPPPVETKAIDVDQVLQEERWATEIRSDAESVVLGIFSKTAARVGEDLDVEETLRLDLNQPDVQDAVRARVQRIMATTEQRAELVRQTIMDRDASDDDLEAIIEAVRGTYEQRQIWASGVARDEVTPAVNIAALTQAAKVGVTTKTWLSSRDEKVRHTHTSAGGGDGQERGLFSPFLIGGFPLLYPGDPTGPPQEVRGCRCVMTFSVDESVRGDDEGQERDHPYLWHVLSAVERLLDWVGGLELPENLAVTPNVLGGRGHLLELLAELLHVHAAQARTRSSRAPATRARVLETLRELGTPQLYVRSVELALRAAEGDDVQ